MLACFDWSQWTERKNFGSTDLAQRSEKRKEGSHYAEATLRRGDCQRLVVVQLNSAVNPIQMVFDSTEDWAEMELVRLAATT